MAATVKDLQAVLAKKPPKEPVPKQAQPGQKNTAASLKILRTYRNPDA